MKEKFLCTRPRMAAHLMAQGYKCVKLPSPFREGYFVWEFDADEELAKMFDIFTVEVDCKKHRSKGGDNI